MTDPELALRRATPEDVRFVWEVNNEPSVRAQSISTAAIPWETHQAWFARKLMDANARIFIATYGDERAAVVRFDIDGSEATIGVSVIPSFRGRGVGAQAIAAASKELAREQSGICAVALVRPDNTASLRAFARAGYVRTGSVVQSDVQLDRLEWR